MHATIACMKQLEYALQYAIFHQMQMIRFFLFYCCCYIKMVQLFVLSSLLHYTGPRYETKNIVGMGSKNS